MHTPIFRLFALCAILSAGIPCYSQKFPHLQAHAHNDYEHPHPLKDALKNGFISVEADVHLVDGDLRVAHSHASKKSPLLETAYLAPLDSLISAHGGHVYKESEKFYLMIDIKTDGKSTYEAIQKLLKKYPSLLCLSKTCAVQIFISGERPPEIMDHPYEGIAVDGRPGDIESNFSVQWMPVVSDNYSKWSSWNGKSKPTPADIERIVRLAAGVHGQGRKLRLWAIPDNELAWDELLKAGVDLINTDHLEELNAFLTAKGL